MSPDTADSPGQSGCESVHMKSTNEVAGRNQTFNTKTSSGYPESSTKLAKMYKHRPKLRPRMAISQS